MSANKTHYRKVFKSDHLGSADLEEFIEENKPLIFTIKNVQQEYGTKVAGRKIDANIAYFKENIKPLVLNATNSKVVKKLAGGSPFVEDWKNVTIQLYIDRTVKMKGEVVGGVRIKDEPPKILSKAEVESMKSKILECNTREDLTSFYNSNKSIKTNQELVAAIKDRANSLNN